MSQKQKIEESGQDSLFSALPVVGAVVEDKLPSAADLTDAEKLKDEKTLLGIYLTTHPLASASLLFASHNVKRIADLEPGSSGSTIKLGGMFTRMRQVQTKKSNALMAFASFEDMSGSLETVIFPKTFEAVKDVLILNQPVVISGKIESREDSPSLILETCLPVNSQPDPVAVEGALITIPRSTPKENVKRIGDLLKSHPGDTKISIKMGESEHASILTLPYTVDFTPSLENEIKMLVK
jgi:DNA polymerase III subunit alpha